jgi:hypothetical protein
MKKLFSLLLLALTVISANAQNSSTHKADAKKEMPKKNGYRP